MYVQSVKFLACMLVAAPLLGGCSKKLESDGLATGSTTPAAAPGAGGEAQTGSYVKTRELALAWQAHPGDENIGLAYADALDKLGQQGTEMDVLKSISVAHATDATLQATIGKKLLTAGRAGEAATILERAVATGKADSTVYSALGSAYDQQGQYEMARAQYNKALSISPNSLPVENNLGMSYALQGKLAEAEKVLRMALSQPGSAAVPRIRQNLALVVGLQGRFDEAKQIAAADLPPDQVEANLNYLKQMLAKKDTWAQLKDQNAAN